MSKRTRKGGGTVFWDADRGCYTGQFSYYNEAGKRKRPKVYAATETKCWEKLDELRGEFKKTGSVAARDLTVGDVISDLLAHPPASWKSPLTTVNKKNYAARITDALGKAKVARLTVAQVERFLEDTAAEGCQPTRCGDCGRCCAWRSGGRSGTARSAGMSPTWPWCQPGRGGSPGR